MTSSGEKPPLKLLALDGGGIRGLSELLIIKEVMHKLMVEENEKRKNDGEEPLTSLPKPCDYFDLIGGTSTGGIIALMLGRLRMDVDTAIQHYDDLTKKVFSDMKLWGDGKFKAKKLEEVIKFVVETVTHNSESSLLESDEDGVCRTFVCAKNAHNINANIPVLFRTYQSHETHPDCKIWEAARATSAAPTFFKRIEIGRKQPFIDGGLGRNNPSLVVLDEAKALFGARLIGCLLSIGTGQTEVINIKKPGLFQQIIPTDVIDALKAITTDCEATHEEMLGRFANVPNTYFRLNVDQGMQGIELSEWEKFSNVEAHTAQYMKRREVNEKLALLVNAIRVPRAQLTLEQLISPRPPIESVQQNQHVRERKLCPLPVPSFTGRKEILDKMHGYFGSDCDSQRVFVLHGLGGSGKSQLAFKFVEKSTCFSDVFYVDATNEQTLQTDLEAITPGNTERSVDASLRWLASQHAGGGNWLLFFDNADNVDLKLKKFFPMCVSGNILITTRNRDLRNYSGKDADAKVEGMDQEDATNLLLRMARVEESDENKALGEAIVQELHYFALAVSQAGAYIYCDSSLSEYREFYLRERDHLLQDIQFQNKDPYEQAVYATWKQSYDKLDTSARSFLQICSILHHQGISEQMFENAALSQLQLEDSELQNEVTRLLNQLGKQDLGWSSWAFRKVMKCLGSYSLIEYDDQSRTYSIHPLVHYWSGTIMEENKHVIQRCVLTIIGLSIPYRFKNEDFKYRHTLLQHISKSRAVLDLEEIMPSVLEHIALVYMDKDQWTEAEVLQVVVMEKRKQMLGDDHPDTLRSMEYLSTTYEGQRRWKEAEALNMDVWEKMKRAEGDDHPDTLWSMHSLAHTYSKQRNWKEAEELQVVLLEKRIRVLGYGHRDTLQTMADLAVTYRNQGSWKLANIIEERVLKNRKLVLGDNHPDTLESMANLAVAYWNQGNWKEAEALEVVVLEQRKKVLGDDHRITLLNMSNLAVLYANQRRWEEAEALEIEVLEKRKQVLGEDHPDTLRSMENLSRTYEGQRRWKEAEALNIDVWEKMKRAEGDDHPDTLRSMENLSRTYEGQSRWKEAEALNIDVWEKMKRAEGDDHPDTLRSMGILARAYSRQGSWKEAEALQTVLLEKRVRVLGDYHRDTLQTMFDLAVTFRGQESWEMAEMIGWVVLERRKQVLEDNHPDTLQSMEDLAVTYLRQGPGNLKEAEALEMVVLEQRKQVFGDDHPITLNAMSILALIYAKQGRWEEAEALEVVALEKRKQVLGDDHPKTLESMGRLKGLKLQLLSPSPPQTSSSDRELSPSNYDRLFTLLTPSPPHTGPHLSYIDRIMSPSEMLNYERLLRV